MPHIASSLVVITMGALCALIAWLGHTKGEILTGIRMTRWKPSAEDNPLAFYFCMIVYCVMAVTFVTWGIAILLGFAKPMPWR